MWKHYCGCGNVAKGVSDKQLIYLAAHSDRWQQIKGGWSPVHWAEFPLLQEGRRVIHRQPQSVRWLLSSHSCPCFISQKNWGFCKDMTLFYSCCHIVEVIAGSFIILEFWACRLRYAFHTVHRDWVVHRGKKLLVWDRNFCLHFTSWRCYGVPRCHHIFMAGSCLSTSLPALAFWFLQYAMHKT